MQIQNKVIFEDFFGSVNAPKFSFMGRSITGRHVEKNDDYLKIQLEEAV